MLLSFFSGALLVFYIEHVFIKDYLKELNKLKPLIDVIKLVRANYITKINEDSLVKIAVSSIISKLDPYSMVIPEDNIQEVFSAIEGKFCGVGMELGMIRDTPYVVHSLFNSPAFKSKILPGTKILKVDNKQVAGGNISLKEIVKIIRGEEDTEISLTIINHLTDSISTVTLKRKSIEIPAIKFAKVINDILTIRISNFTVNQTNELKELVSKFSDEEIKGIILDLRNNEGGVLSSAIELTKLFLHKDDTIIFIITQDSTLEHIVCKEDGVWCNIPLVVLVNENTISASEVVAAAIQENDRGLILGSPTFGKSFIQEQYSVPGIGLLRLTTSKYLTSSRRELSSISEMSFHYKNGRALYKTSRLKRYLFEKAPVYPDIFTEDLSLSPEILERAKNIDIINLVINIIKRNPNLSNFSIASEFITFIDTLNLSGYIDNNQNNSSNFINYLKMKLAYHFAGWEGYYAFYYRMDPSFLKANEIIKNPERITPELQKILTQKF